MYSSSPARPPWRFPALIQLQYAGVYALNARAAALRGAEGWLMINVDAHDKLPTDPSGNVPRTYQAVGNTDRETSYFLNMYLRDSRALDYLLTRADWDGRTIVVTGGSMGGQQSFALAGLRPEKISAVLVCVPARTRTAICTAAISGPVEALPMIDCEHDNLTPDQARPCSVRTNNILEMLVRGGTFTPQAPVR